MPNTKAIISLSKYIIIVVFAVLLTACHPKTEEQRILEVYNEFITLRQGTLKQREKAILEYLYFPNQNHYQAQLEGIEVNLKFMGVEHVEQLSDKLWLIQYWGMTPGIDEAPALISYFVANIDGAYKILLNTELIPADLADGVDLEPYTLPPCFTHIDP